MKQPYLREWNWYLPTGQLVVHLVSRPKLNGVGTHFGVAVEIIATGFVRVYDATSSEGFRELSLAGFCDGKRYRIESTLINRRGIEAAFRRLEEVEHTIESSGFSVFDRNCEQVARYVLTGTWESKQLQTLTALGIAALVLRWSA